MDKVVHLRSGWWSFSFVVIVEKRRILAAGVVVKSRAIWNFTTIRCGMDGRV